MAIDHFRQIPNEPDEPAPPWEPAGNGNGHGPHHKIKARPHSIPAEEAALGAMLLKQTAVDDCLPILEPGHFYVERHANTFAAIQQLAARHTPIDPVTVAEQLRTSGTMPDDGPSFLINLQIGTPASDNAASYAHIVAEKARLRRYQDLLAEGRTAADDGDLGGVLDIVDRLATDTIADAGTSSWSLVDVAAVLAGQDLQPTPTILARTDGNCLLYPGRINAFNAESEAGKTWAACVACLAEVHQQRHVVFYDFEDDAAGILGRMRLLGATDLELVDYFHYVRPDDPLDPTARALIQAVLRTHQPSLVVIDGVTEVLVQNGWSINDNDDIAAFIAALPRAVARTGAAVLLIDHVTKDREGRGRFAIGAQHKLAAVTGAAYTIENIRPFAEGRDGMAKITVQKDKPGRVRSWARHGTGIGEMHVRTTPAGVTLTIVPANTDSEGVRPTNLMEKVSRALEGLPEPINASDLRRLVPGKSEFKDKALKILIAEGYVEVTGAAKNAKLHRSVTPYREPADEPVGPVDNYQEEWADEPF